MANRSVPIEIDLINIDVAKEKVSELKSLLEQVKRLIHEIAAPTPATLTAGQAKEHLEEALTRILGE